MAGSPCTVATVGPRFRRRSDTSTTSRSLRLTLCGRHVGFRRRSAPNLFGPASEELKMIQAVLGEVPLIGFFGNGEISNNRLYTYTGVLSVFRQVRAKSPVSPGDRRRESNR